jgi:protein TonB
LRRIIINTNLLFTPLSKASIPFMSSKYSSLISLLLVTGAHVGVLAAVVMSKSDPAPVEIIQPTIQGVIVMAEPEAVPPPPEPPPPPPPPEKKPEPTPKPKPKPLPKAPPSERAVKAPEPEPTPPPPVERPPAEPRPPAPAPVVPPRAEAGQLNNPAPVYPTLSRRLREEGTVTLEILIRADGSVGEIKLKTSSGFKRLDDAAMTAVKRWRYQPATQGGKAIDFWYELPLEFNLH